MRTWSRITVAWVSLDHNWLFSDNNRAWLDDDWTFDNDRTFNCNRRRRPVLRCRRDWAGVAAGKVSLLHHADHLIVDALAVQGDDLVDSDLLLDAMSLDLADDHIASRAYE